MNIHELNYALNWLEKHPADVNKSAWELIEDVKAPIDYATWMKAKKFTLDDMRAATAGMQKQPQPGDTTIVHINITAKTANVTHNGTSRTFHLKAMDMHALIDIYKKRGYKYSYMGDVALLTKKIAAVKGSKAA